MPEGLDLSKFKEALGAGLAKPKEASAGPLPLAQKVIGSTLDYLTTPSRAPSAILAKAAGSLSSAYSAKIKADYSGKDPYEQYLQGAKDRNAIISKAFSMAAQTVQSPFRAGGTVGLSALEAATNRKQDLYFSGNPILKKLVGADDIRSIQTRMDQGGSSVMGYGGSPLEAKLYPVAGMVASAALDFTGTGSGGKKVLSGMSDDLLEYLAKETDEKAIARALSMKGMRSSEAKALSAQFAKATDRKGVQEIADSVLGAEARKAAVESQIPDDFDPAAYAREQIAAREAAYAGEKKGAVQKAKDVYARLKASLVDSAAPIEDPIAREAKKSGIEFAPSKDIHNQIDVAMRSDGAARVFMKDNGFDRTVQDVSRMGDEALPLFDQYLVARHATDLSAAGIQTGRDMAKDAAFLKAYTPMFEKSASDMTAYSQKLLDYSVERGLIAPELAARLKEIYPNYVPMNRVFSELEQEGSQFAKAGGVASLSKQDIVQRIEGSTREVENPLVSLMNRTHKAFAQGETNKAAQMLVDAGKQLPELGIRPIRTAEQVKTKMDIIKELKEFRPVRDALERVVSRKGKEIRDLQTELRRLNKQGLSEALRKEYRESPEQLKSAIRTTIRPEEYKVNAPKSFDQLTNNYATKDILQKEFKTFDLLEMEVHMGGWSRLEEVGIPKNQAESVAKQIFKEPTFKPQMTRLDDELVRMSNRDPKKFIESLILDDDSSIDAIKGKISRRETKVSAFMDELQGIRKEFDDIKASRSELWKDAQMIKDAPVSEGKDTFSVINGGIKEIWEAPEAMAAAARNLNQEQLSTVLKIVRWSPRIARAGITAFYPPFVLANFAKDQVFAAIMSKDGIRNSVLNPFVFVPALIQSLKHGQLYDEFMRSGASTLSYDMSRGAAKDSLEKIAAGRSKAAMAGHIIRTPSEWLRAIENGFGVTENLTRMQQYVGTKKRALKAGMSEADAIAEAARAARENTANFMRGGSQKGAIGALWLYMNAGIQGGRTLINAVEKRPAQTISKIAGGLLFPVAALAAYNMSDPEKRKIYEDIQDYEKDGNLIFIPDGASGPEDAYKFPLPAGVNQLTIPVRKAIEAMQGLGEVSFADVAQGLLGTVLPVDVSSPNRAYSSLLPQMLKAPTELMTNTNLFTENPIVPASKQNLSPEYQVKDGTSGTARIIGKAVDASPLKVEHLFRSVFGGLGTYSLNLSDRILAGQDLIPEDQIGGKTMAEAVAARFKGASGGRIANREIESIQKALQSQGDASAKLKMEAEALFEELSQIPKAEANARLLQIAAKDAALGKQIRSVISESKQGLEAQDRFMLQLNVGNGARADYIAKKALDIESESERKAYLNGLIQKKVITKDVESQIKKILRNKESQL